MVIAVVDVVLSAIAVWQAFKALQATLKVAGKKALRTSAQNGVTGEKLPNSQGGECNPGKCFIAGTKVKTEDGYKNIEEVEVGDKVLAYDEETGKQAYKEVKRLFRNESKEWTIVKVNGEEIESTSGHKYYLPEKKEWRSAEELKEGDKVLLWDGRYGIIESVKSKHYDKSQTTYNFEVEDFHTYYVGTGVCVHNKNCYTYEHGVYEDAPYHTSTGNSVKSPKPIDGQAALDNSIQIKPTSPRRLGYSNGQFVVLDETRPGLYHGHVPKLPHKEARINNIIRKWRFK